MAKKKLKDLSELEINIEIYQKHERHKEKTKRFFRVRDNKRYYFKL